MAHETLTALVAIAGVLGIVSGAVLLLMPRQALSDPTRWRRWLLEIDFAGPFARRYSIERTFYRRHRAFGVAVIAGALAWLSLLWGLRGRQWVEGALAAMLGSAGIRVLTMTGAIVGLLALAFGVLLLVRPSTLKGIEAAVNRWIEPFPGLDGKADVSRLVVRAPRLVGLILLAAGLGCFRVLAG